MQYITIYIVYPFDNENFKSWIKSSKCPWYDWFCLTLNSIILSDVGLFGIDEALALSICGDYGVIGKTNFGNLDVNKPGKIYQLQKNNEHCHCFLDDIVGAIAANASILIAQEHASKSI